MSEDNQELKQLLESTAYGELKNKFEELGIEEAWKPGSKKSVMIADALQKIQLVKELRSKGVVEEAIPEEVNKIQDKIKEQEKLEAAKKADSSLSAYNEYKNKLAKLKLSKDDIYKNLKLINSNLKNGVTNTARQILLHKKKALMELLDEKIKQDE